MKQSRGFTHLCVIQGNVIFLVCTVLIPRDVGADAMPVLRKAHCLYQLTSAKRERFGIRVKSVEDVDGDGYSDILVGTQATGGDLSDIHVYSGRSGSWLYTLPKVAPSWNAPEFNEYLGSCGDVDGDGSGDFIVAHSCYLIEGDGIHMASVFSGATGTLLRQHEGPSEVVREVDSALNTLDQLGDLDHDGVTDYGIVDTLNGLIWTFSGKEGRTLAEIRVRVPDSFTRGKPIVPLANGIGDVNGNGKGDIGIVSNSRSFMSFVDGGLRGPVDVGWPPTHALLQPGIDADSPYQQWGLTGVGDLTQDSYADVLWGGYSGEDRTPLVALISGADGATVWKWSAPASYRMYDRVSGTIGDVDRDGVPDVIVGGHTIENGQSGFVVLLSGRTGEELARIDDDGSGWRFGSSVAILDDLNHDGIREFAVGANSAPSRQGAVFVYSIAPDPVDLRLEIQNDRTILLHRPTSSTSVESSADLRVWTDFPTGPSTTTVIPRQSAQYFRIRR